MLVTPASTATGTSATGSARDRAQHRRQRCGLLYKQAREHQPSVDVCCHVALDMIQFMRESFSTAPVASGGSFWGGSVRTALLPARPAWAAGSNPTSQLLDRTPAAAPHAQRGWATFPRPRQDKQMRLGYVQQPRCASDIDGQEIEGAGGSGRCRHATPPSGSAAGRELDCTSPSRPAVPVHAGHGRYARNRRSAAHVRA